jgi:hypothetical protein
MQQTWKTINAYKSWPENVKETDHLEDLGTDGRILSK